MNRTTVKSATTLAMIVGLCTANSALATPVTGLYQDDAASCDNHGVTTLSHELGPVPAGFPLNEGLIVNVSNISTPSHFSCGGDDGVFNEYELRITNISGQEWTNLFFVADQGAGFTNVDGFVDDTAFPAPSQAVAFRIDGTVTPGVNNPLINEDVTTDEILQIGETWSFLVDNWFPFASPPLLGSVGKFADSSSIGLDTVSTASILATPVPEPAAATIFSLAILATLKRKRS